MADRRDPARLDASVNSALDGNFGRYEAEVMRNYREALRSIRADMSILYERFASEGVLTHAEMSKFDRLRKLEKNLTSDLAPAMSKNRNLIERMSRVEYDEAFYRNAWAIDQQAGVAVQWGLLRPESVTESVANPLRKIAETRLRADGRIRIRRAVTQGLIRGASFPAMMRGIRDAINGNAADALRIVRTEGQRAQVLGQQATYDKARDRGVEVTDVWDAALDSRTRSEHGALDGLAALTDETGTYWITAVGRVSGPLQSGVASFDINCRCRVIGQVEGFESEVRRVRGEGRVPYQNYYKWREGLNARGRNTVKPSGSPDWKGVFRSDSEKGNALMVEGFKDAPDDLRAAIARMPVMDGDSISFKGVRGEYAVGRDGFIRRSHAFPPSTFTAAKSLPAGVTSIRRAPTPARMRLRPNAEPRVARHEYGHVMEYERTGNIVNDAPMYSIIESVNKKLSSRSAAGKSLIDEVKLKVEGTQVVRKPNGFVIMNPSGVKADMQDLFGAITKDRIGVGHGKAYYKPDMWDMLRNLDQTGGDGPPRVGHKQLSEVMANLTDVYGRKDRSAWTWLEGNFPEITKEYREWLKT